MPKVHIDSSLAKQIVKKFSKSEAHVVTDLIESLEQNPYKGKNLGSIGTIALKELKYKGFRFYCIYDGHNLKVIDEERIVDLLFRFVRMSNKKDQQKTINEIKEVLKKIGPSGL